MLQNFRNNPKESFYVQYARARLSIGLGMTLGGALGGLLLMLFSRWLPESFLMPLFAGSAVLLGILFYVFWPIAVVQGDPEDHPDNITPAERVRRDDGEK